MAAAFAAIAIGIDASGISVGSTSPSDLRFAAVVAAFIFFIITAWREYEWFLRQGFRNDAPDPTGSDSTAQMLTAAIKVIGAQGGQMDSWTGRWANLDEPSGHAEKWQIDRIDLPPNGQEAILDLFVRYDGQPNCYGWDNSVMLGTARHVPIGPGQYRIEVTLRGANMKRQLFNYVLIVSDDVHVRPIVVADNGKLVVWRAILKHGV